MTDRRPDPDRPGPAHRNGGHGTLLAGAPGVRAALPEEGVPASALGVTADAQLAVLHAGGRRYIQFDLLEAAGHIDRLRTGLLADLERIDPGAATGIRAGLAWDIDMGDYPSEETR